MGEIYWHAWCNIAATGFDNGRSGMFGERNPHLVMKKARAEMWHLGANHVFNCTIWLEGVLEAPLYR